jgi:NTE family protein
MTLKGTTVLLVFVLLGSGCAHYPINAPLATVDARTGYRFENTAFSTNSDDLLLMLAFSGGGIRAAALDYGVLEELARTGVGPPSEQHRLLDEVDLVSAVSGGSFTAACYALWGDRIFSDFEPQFLKKPVQNALRLRILAPWNVVRLLSPTFDRSDLAAEYYDRLLFKGATFGDLAARPGAPFLIINATDLTSGARFEFTQDQFDFLKSDLSQFPIARAVAASSAFPVLLSPIVLDNYSAGHQSPEPEWIRVALTNQAASSRLRNLALQTRSYLDGDKRRFIHLIDGGISDNLGLRGSTDNAVVYAGGSRPSPALQKTRRIAVIIVDANTDPDYGWDSTERSPGLWDLLGLVGRVPIRRYSFETIELFRETMARLARETSAVRLTMNGPRELTIYTVELHFNQLADDSDRRFFNSVPTRFQLPSATVDRLRRIAAAELARNAEFQRLIRDLKNGSNPAHFPTQAGLSQFNEGDTK